MTHTNPFLAKGLVALGLAVSLIITAVLYTPGLDGSFLFDDEANITANEPVQVESLSLDALYHAAFSMNAGPLMRPLSMLSFALNHYFHGLDPFYFKLTNLIIHLTTGIALFFALRFLLELFRHVHRTIEATHRDWIALAVTAIWLLHPLNLTSVLYVVQRMNALAALFSLLSMLSYFYGRLRQFENKSGSIFIVIGLGILYPLGVLSKENALLLPLFLLLAEWLLLRFHGANPVTKRGLMALYVITVGLPAIAFFSLLAIRFDGLVESYTFRTFNLEERLLTEARVIWFYLGLIVLPRLSSLGLYHDDIAISHGLLEPSSTLWAILGLIGLVAGAFLARRKAPLLSFGILFFFAGHSMESTVFPLEIAHEHRNYLPIVGILVIVCYYLFRPGLTLKFTLLKRSTAFVLLIFMAGLTALRASAWGDPLHHVLLDAAYHPASSRGHYEAGRVYFALIRNTKDSRQKEEFYKKAEHHFTQAYQNDDYHSAGLIALLWLDSIVGKPINDQWLSMLQRRLQRLPMSPHNIAALRNLNQCQNEGDCPLPNGLLDSLLDSALDNGTLKGQPRSILLTESLIRSVKRGDMERALQTSKEAVESYPPMPQLWLNRFALLLESGQLDEAREVITTLAGLDLTQKEKESLSMFSALLHRKQNKIADPSNDKSGRSRG